MNDKPAQQGQVWEQRFRSPAYVFGTRPNAWLAAQVDALRLPAGRALMVADGEGRNGVWLARRGWQVESFDIAPSGVAKSRALAAAAGVHVDSRVCGWQEWSWRRGSYDLVAAIFIQFVPPEEREDLFARMRAALAPGGVLVVQGYTPRQLDYRSGGPDRPGQLYTRDWLLSQVAGLDLLDFSEKLEVLQEGLGHLGLSATIAVAARQPAGVPAAG